MNYQLSLWNIELDREQRVRLVSWASPSQATDAAQWGLLIGVAGLAGFLLALLAFGRSGYPATEPARRRRLPAIGLAIVMGGLLATAVAVLVPKHYQAEAMIKISAALPVVGNPIEPPRVSDSEYESCKIQVMQLFKSDLLLRQVLRMPKIRELRTVLEQEDDPQGVLQHDLIVEFPDDGELMRVAVRGTHRDDLSIIVNAVVEKYLTQLEDRTQDLRTKSRVQLENLLENKQAFLQQKQELAALVDQSKAQAEQREQLAKSLETLGERRKGLTEGIEKLDLLISELKERQTTGN